MATPASIGKYQIIDSIAKGGMGAIYKARHPTLDKLVIIKKLTHSDNKDIVERFKREAQIQMDFVNERIVQVYDHFKAGTSYYLVMEYVDGMTLEELIRQKRSISNPMAFLLFAEICKAIQHAHDHKVIHRDIKPANILISKKGEVKLVDFGVASSLEAEIDDGLTRAGMTIGTPAYLAPEQIGKANERDKRSDIYSLGVVLYEMLTGKKPFPSGFTPEVIDLIKNGKYDKIKKINPRAHSTLARISAKSMHHKIGRRFQDLVPVIRKLDRFNKAYATKAAVDLAISQYLQGREEPLPPKPPRAGLGKLLAKALAVLILVGGLAVGWQVAERQGWLDELLNADSMGALQLEVLVQNTDKRPDQIYLNLDLFRQDKGKFFPVHHRALHLGLATQNKGQIKFASPRFYLPQGRYKLILAAENEFFQEEFVLKPRSLQKLQAKSQEQQTFAYKTQKGKESLPVSLEITLLDEASQKQIKSGVKQEIHWDKNWMALEEFLSLPGIEGLFVTGRSYQFRFSAPQYKSEQFQLFVGPLQNRLNLTVTLSPAPVTLWITADADDYRLSLNNGDSYLAYDEAPEVRPLPRPVRKTQRINLAPGDYFVTVKKVSLTGSDLSATRQIHPAPGEQIQLMVSQNNQELQLEIKPKE